MVGRADDNRVARRRHRQAEFVAAADRVPEAAHAVTGRSSARSRSSTAEIEARAAAGKLSRLARCAPGENAVSTL